MAINSADACSSGTEPRVVLDEPVDLFVRQFGSVAFGADDVEPRSRAGRPANASGSSADMSTGPLSRSTSSDGPASRAIVDTFRTVASTAPSPSTHTTPASGSRARCTTAETSCLGAQRHRTTRSRCCIPTDATVVGHPRGADTKLGVRRVGVRRRDGRGATNSAQSI